MQHKKIVAVPVLLPAAPRVSPVVPQVTVPVLSNISSERKLFTSTIDLGKNSLLLSSSKLNISVPCVVPCDSFLLSPTSKIYVYPVADPPATTHPTIVPTAADPTVATPVVSDPITPLKLNADPFDLIHLNSSADPFVPTQFHHHHYEPDRLDDLIQTTSCQYLSSTSWGDFVRSVRGRGDLHPDISQIPHPASHLLSRFQKVGTPAIMSDSNWNKGQIEAALKRGPHSSSKNGIDFLRNEFADMIDKQQWIVLPANMIKKLFRLRLSPIGLVPQNNRRDRMISDYSYYDVNADTLNIAPTESMQFGRTLWRLLNEIHHANSKFGPVYMSKIDLSDGFYRLWLRPEDTPALAVLLPTRENEPPLIGIPLTNPMGWVSSPPNFSSCTETVADMANADLDDPVAMAKA